MVNRGRVHRGRVLPPTCHTIPVSMGPSWVFSYEPSCCKCWSIPDPTQLSRYGVLRVMAIQILRPVFMKMMNNICNNTDSHCTDNQVYFIISACYCNTQLFCPVARGDSLEHAYVTGSNNQMFCQKRELIWSFAKTPKVVRNVSIKGQTAVRNSLNHPYSLFKRYRCIASIYIMLQYKNSQYKNHQIIKQNTEICSRCRSSQNVIIQQL